MFRTLKSIAAIIVLSPLFIIGLIACAVFDWAHCEIKGHVQSSDLKGYCKQCGQKIYFGKHGGET